MCAGACGLWMLDIIVVVLEHTTSLPCPHTFSPVHPYISSLKNIYVLVVQETSDSGSFVPSSDNSKHDGLLVIAAISNSWPVPVLLY